MITGKTTMCWNVPAISNGDPQGFVEMLKIGKFDGVAIKAADAGSVYSMSKYGPWPSWGANVKPELVNALRAAKKKVYFWHFVYGEDPQAELNIAKEICDTFQPDGWIWNAETAFDKKPNAVNNARILSVGLKRSHPHISQGLCWWALPESPTSGAQWHPKKVAQAFLETVDTGMPMVYWQGIGANAAVDYLHKSLTIWRKMTRVPITPIGRTFNGTGGYTDPAGIKAFDYEVHRLSDTYNLVGVSWYSFDKSVTQMTWFEALSQTNEWSGRPVFLSLEEKVERLVKNHPDLFPELF